MRNKTRNMVLTALFAALTAAGAFVKIPIGPAPITLQFLFTALAGVLLGPYLGALSQLIYVALGLAGVPIFTMGGGPGYVFNPTFGYLLGFIIAPLIIGKLCERTAHPSFLRTFLACILSSLVIYAIGVPYMFMILRNVVHMDITFTKTLLIGCIVFLPGDVAKSAVVALLGKKILPILRRKRND